MHFKIAQLKLEILAAEEIRGLNTEMFIQLTGLRMNHDAKERELRQQAKAQQEKQMEQAKALQRELKDKKEQVKKGFAANITAVLEKCRAQLEALKPKKTQKRKSPNDGSSAQEEDTTATSSPQKKKSKK